ncbi:MAG: hypothetical protein E7158_04355 [Firmicutes bacterium]|nr:hypothetical protein [Bacillota bacterium]
MNKKSDNKNEQTKREKFKELWGNTRTKAIIKLGMWGAFFVIMFVITMIFSLVNGYKKQYSDLNNKNVVNENSNEKVEVNIVGMLQKLLNGSYSYKYTITNGEETYSYSGTKDENSDLGYFENKDGIVKYEILNAEYYKIINGEKISDNTFINEQDKNIVELKDIIIRINNYEEVNKPQITDNIYIYDLSFEENKYYVNITIDKNNISKIDINYNDTNYILEYKNIINSNVN